METLKVVALLIGGPIYLYFLVRWMTSAIVRSYFEVKIEFYELEIRKTQGGKTQGGKTQG